MNIIRRRMIAIALILSLTIIPVTATEAKENTIIIVLDPGHGGMDSGAYHHSVMEKNVNLKIAQFMKNELSTYNNVKVKMTRNSDIAVGLQQRVDIAKQQQADLVVSIHANSSDSSVTSGAEIFYPNGNFISTYNRKISYEKTKQIASELEKGLVALGLRDCGIKTRNSRDNVYKDGSVADYYYVIRETKKLGIPAVLIEHGYISNASDVSNYFSSDEKLQVLARENVKTLEKTLNLSKDSKGDAKIAIKAPVKTEYLVGEGFDSKGLQVTATYNDGNNVVLKPNEYKITGFDSSKLGNRLITISYMNATAQFVVCVVPEISKSTILGDVNGDGEIKASDYAIIKDSIMTGLALSDMQLKRADVKQDQSLKASDYLMIKDYIMGVLEKLPSLEQEKPEVEKPEVEKPEVEKPEVEKPEIEKPEVEKPEVEKPEVEKPEVEKPEAEKPEVEKPEVEKPEAEKPEVEKPEVEKPEVEKPEVEKPEVEKPEAEKPEVEKPEVEKPEAEKPEVEKPEVETPEADKAIGGNNRLDGEKMVELDKSIEYNTDLVGNRISQDKQTLS